MFCAFKSIHNFYYTHFMSNKKYTNSHNYTNPVHLVFTGVASINTFITLNHAGLKDDIMTILAGGMVRVNTNTFKNDFSTIASKDDSLTALIHLGYLGYDSVKKKAFIPNYEVATAFEAALQTGEWTEIAKAISTCDELLDETIDGNADRVAELIELAHDTYTSVLKYNDETFYDM